MKSSQLTELNQQNPVDLLLNLIFIRQIISGNLQKILNPAQQSPHMRAEKVPLYITAFSVCYRHSFYSETIHSYTQLAGTALLSTSGCQKQNKTINNSIHSCRFEAQI